MPHGEEWDYSHSKIAYLLLMHTVLSITVVIVALFCEYSTNVWTTSSLRFGKYGIKALGDIRVTPSTQRNLGALGPVGATKPRIEVIEHVTDKEASIEFDASEQKFVYSLTIPTERYQTWSNWSKCDPIDCVQRRRRECADGSWKPSDVNRSGARRCPSRYYEVTRTCKNKKTCLTYGMLENCGIQSANEDAESNPTGDKRTTSNSWPWLDSCERDCRSGLYCKLPYTNKWLLAGVRNYGTETEGRPGTGIYTSAITENEWIWSRIGKSPT
ncbi:unnamed protein product [Dicrocoelium dendriticum]|nr:unnamed protein product [Dicrocoelium dendriticum]